MPVLTPIAVATAPHVALGTTTAGQDGSMRVNSGPNGEGIGGATTAGIYVTDPNAAGRASVAVDDYFFGQALVGFSAASLTDLVVGAGTGNTLRLAYACDRDGAHTDVMTVNGTTGAIGVFSKAGTGATQQTGGAFTFGATYTAAEQAKCQAMWDALRAYGLLT